MIERGVKTIDVEIAVAFDGTVGNFFYIRADDLARSIDAICFGLKAHDIERGVAASAVEEAMRYVVHADVRPDDVARSIDAKWVGVDGGRRLPLPAPTQQTHCTEPRGERRESGG
jgi:hypothetical protein